MLCTVGNQTWKEWENNFCHSIIRVLLQRKPLSLKVTSSSSFRYIVNYKEIAYSPMQSQAP